MQRTAGTRVLRIAIAGSLFVHALFALTVRTHTVAAAPEQRPTHVMLIVLHLPKPTPTPQPRRPHVTAHAQKQSVLRRLPMQLPRISHTGTGANHVIASAAPGTPGPYVSDASPGPAQTAVPSVPPTASPTPKPACSAPDVDARAIDTVTPEVPADAVASGVQTKVRVDLDASGAVTGASVYQTSGDQQLDIAAVRAAKSSRYAPEQRACKNVSGSYLFTVDFQE